MKSLTNWLLTGLICLGGYLFLVTWVVATHPDSIPIRWRLEEWWAAGGVCLLVSVIIGYVLLQFVARGTLTPGLIVKGRFLWLLPFFLAGNCAGDACQGMSALGTFGNGSKMTVRIADKHYSDYRGFRLIVRDSSGGVLEWELPDGRSFMGFEVPVSEEVYKSHRVGSRISVVELPGEPYPSHRSSAQVEGKVPIDLSFALAWSLVAGLGLHSFRREFLKSAAVGEVLGRGQANE